MALQGYARFGQVSNVLSFNFTLSLGVAPSVARLIVPPVEGHQLYSDTLELQYGSVRLSFPDCRVDKIDVQGDPEGKEVWSLTILDRRWRWREAGRISGYYNVRRDEHTIVPGTELSPRELAKLCLTAMGESGYDLKQLPNEPRPEIEWDYDLPAEALARLCDELGCRVALGLDNRVRVVRLGQGISNLPDYPITEGDYSEDPPDPPEKIIIVGDRVRYQGDFALEPVGLERGGNVVPLAQLSYRPLIAGNAQWCDLDHFNDVKNVKDRRVARESVFRWYRIRAPFTLPNAGTVTSLDRILPLDQSQVQTRQILGRKEPLPPWVYGSFYDGDHSARPAEDDVEDDVLAHPKGFYYRGFAVDVETGIVKFSDPVYTLAFDTAAVYGYVAQPADLRLRIACNLREEPTRGWQRQEFTRAISSKAAKKLRWVRYIVHEDIKREIYRRHTPPAAVVDNYNAVKSQAAYYLDVAERQYQVVPSAGLTYAGFLPLATDGTLQQVTWAIDGQGFATTRAALNKEEFLYTPSYQERRLIERTQAALKYSEMTSRARSAEARKGRA